MSRIGRSFSLALFIGFAAIAFSLSADETGSSPNPWPCPGEYSLKRPELKTETHEPVQIVKKAPGHYFIDFGKAAFGTLAFVNPVPWPESDASIEVHLGEKATADETVDRNPGGTIRYRKMNYTPVNVKEELDSQYFPITITPDQRNTGAAAIKMPKGMEVIPFRYAELIGVPFEMKEEHVAQLAVHYQFEDDDSAFQSSDETLNELWDFCKYTMKATSFCGVFVDGDRERIPYEADAYINMLGWYAATAEFTLPRFSNEYLVQHPTWPTEWQLHIPLMFWADYMHTGDTDSIEMFYDQIRAKTLIALAREDGLISTTDGRFTPEVAESIGIDKLRDIVDWPAKERDGYELLPYNTVVNAFHYASLKKMADMAKALGKQDDVAFFTARAEKVYNSFNKTFFDEQQGVYMDGEGSKHASQHANMWALAFDLVPADRVEKVVELVKSRDMACSVYGSQFLLEALYKHGEADHAFELMTSDSDRSFPHMWREVGSTIALEAWDIKYKPNLDWNHAWGAAPANIIPRYLLGIEPIEPGFAKIRVKPQPGPVRDVKMTLPTIRGPITSTLKQGEEGQLSMQIDMPANMTAEVWMPATGTKSLWIDGKQRDDARRDGNWLIVESVGSGGHTIEVR